MLRDLGVAGAVEPTGNFLLVNVNFMLFDVVLYCFIICV